MDRTSHSLLQIATRIHYALLREIGTGIDIGAMLRQEGYAKEVIYLCRACQDPELRALGECFESLSPDDPPLEKNLLRAAVPAHRTGRRAERSATAPAHRHAREHAFEGRAGAAKGTQQAQSVRLSAAAGAWFRLAH